MKVLRAALVPAFFLTVFTLGCESNSESVAGVEDLTPLFAPRPCVPDDPRGRCSGGGGNGEDPTLIAEGEALFFGETFEGNGRTCGTCHRKKNNMTLDVDFIGKLPAEDLLFIAEFSPEKQAEMGVDLPPFNPMNASVPAFEDPDLMRDRGLILENIQGFENPPVFRAPPSLFNLSFTAPYGLSGDFANLRDFTVGAVVQHFPKTLARVEGVDFRLPTESQLDALEAFMLSLLLPMDGNFKVSGPNSILSTPADPRATDTSRPEVRGRDLLSSVGCTSCHKKSNKVFSGNTLDTGVEAFSPVDGSPDPGDGSDPPRFQTPQLFLRKAGIFHNNAAGNEGTQFLNLRASVAFYDSPEFIASDNGTLVTFDTDPDTKAQQIHDIARFLEAISQE